jgi:Family of unknown function (DUF6535)
LIFTVTQLQPSSTDVALAALVHISLQLKEPSTPEFALSQFTVSTNTAIINGLFFACLALILVDAFLAMLVKGWLRDYDRDWRRIKSPELRARERERRLGVSNVGGSRK